MCIKFGLGLGVARSRGHGLPKHCGKLQGGDGLDLALYNPWRLSDSCR